MIYREMCGEKVSALGFGAMRLPSVDPTDFRAAIDKEAAIALIRKAYESGINYFDTAYVYGGGQSEVVLGEALSIYPRDSYFIATKFPGLHPPKDGWTKEEMARTFDVQLERLKTDYVDFYLLHGIMESDFAIYSDEKVQIPEYFYEQKKAGRIRHFGFSSHCKPELLEKVLKWRDYFEFVQIQLNYLDWNLQNAKKQLELINEAGLPVVVMEPVRGGKLAKVSDDVAAALKEKHPDASAASWALAFAASQPGVRVVLSGMSAADQLEDNLKTINSPMLTEEEQKFLTEKIVPMMVTVVPCTGCRYCCEGCPMGLNIPGLISAYNELKSGTNSFYLGSLKPEEGPQNCIGCGACQSVCPQSIEIPSIMKELSEMMAAGRRH